MAALNQLHQLLQRDNDYCVAYDKHTFYSHNQFIDDLTRAIGNIKQQPHRSYLLSVENSYYFAVNLIALLLLQKDIVLTANSKTEWLAQINSHFDAVIGEPSINPLLSGDHFSSSNLDIDLKLATINFAVPEEWLSTITFFTSGSTSHPKAIRKSVPQLFTEVSSIHTVFGTSVEQCTFLSTVSHHHIYGLIFRLLWPLLFRFPFNAEIVLYQEQLRSVCKELSAVCLISSPAFLSRQDPDLEKLALEQCFSSGSLLSASAAEASFQQLGIYPTEVFGSTETGGIGYRKQTHPNELWTFFPEMMMHKDSNERTLLTSPYLPEPYLLDDDIEIISKQRFRLMGRLDRVVKIEEKRVSLDAIEATLLHSPLVDSAKVVVLQHHRTYLGAIIVLSRRGKRLYAEQHKNFINQCLKSELAELYEAVAIPRKWRYLDQLPYNSQGKLTLNQLLALF